MVEYWKWLNHRAGARDQAETSLADVLDMKASILLVMVVFLAAFVPDVLRVPGLPISLKILQAANAVILGAGVVILTRELWPRKYRFEHEGCLADLGDYLTKYHADINDENMIQMLQNASSEAIARVKYNCGLNMAKQRLLKIAFWLVLVGLLSQVIILFVIGIRPMN